MATIRERYVGALLDISAEKGSFEKDLEQAIIIRDAIDDPDIQSFLLHPKVSDEAKQQLFHKAFSENLSDYLMEVLFHMVRKKRGSLILPALDEYIDLANRRLGKIEAKVVSAKELSEEQKEAIRRILAKKLQMQVELKATVDPEVIGGFYVVAGGLIFDRTVRSELNNMKESLKRGVGG